MNSEATVINFHLNFYQYFVIVHSLAHFMGIIIFKKGFVVNILYLEVLARLESVARKAIIAERLNIGN